MLLHIVSVALGAALIAAVLLSALQTVILPRGGLTAITRFVFAFADRVFIRRHGLPARYGWSGFYAPVSLVLLPLAWATLVTIGFGFIFWGFDAGPLGDSVEVSGSSLFTLGFLKPDGHWLVVLTFLEALIGLGLVALLISFLPTLYSAYSDREKGVVLLSPLCGSPPSAVELISRARVGRVLSGSAVWAPISNWLASLEQSHTAFPSLCSFPSQVDDRSWVVAVGTVLDATSLVQSLLPDDRLETAPELRLVMAHGTVAIGRVAQAAGLPVDVPRPIDDLMAETSPPPAIAVTRAEFDAAIASMQAVGIHLRDDHDAAWHTFAWLRSSYEDAVLGLAGLTHAPPAPWTSDRAYHVGRPRFFGTRPLAVSAPPSASDGGA